MDWIVSGFLLALAAALSAGGSSIMARDRTGRTAGDPEPDARRAILALVLIATAVSVAAVGASVVAAGTPVPAQLAAFAAAVLVVGLPMAVVLISSARRNGPTRD